MPLGYYDVMETAVRELLIDKQVVHGRGDTTADRSNRLAHTDARRQSGCTRLDGLGVSRQIACRWRSACEELGITFYDDTGLIVLENTDKVHNLIVCTLCSCYPRPVLGLPPDWYKLKPYRARAVSEPRAVLAEFGTIIPEDVEIRVSDSTAMVRYLVLPKRPAGTEGFDEAQLAALVTRDAMIGVVEASVDSGRSSA